MAAEAVAFYLVAYTVMSLGAFGVVSILSSSDHDAASLDEYRGLFWRRPFVSGILTLMLLSLAGIPATIGFLAKFYVITTGASQATWSLLMVLVVASAIGLFYYLRVIVTLYSLPSREATPLHGLPRASGIVLAALTLVLIGVGVYPTPLVSLIRAAMTTLR